MNTNTVRLITAGLAVLLLGVLTGCPPPPRPVEAITTSHSHTVLDFGTFRGPMQFDVWNTRPDLGTLDISLTPTRDWIIIEGGRTVQSAGPDDRQLVTVRIDRSKLPAGGHEGAIRCSAPRIMTHVLPVFVTQETDPPDYELRLEQVNHKYSQPYLLDFFFSLRDEDGDQIVAEPAQFEATPRENGAPVGLDTPVFFQRGAARQLKLVLVLDYSLSMQQAQGAIAAMEDAATNTLLPTLNADAQVAVIEFHTQFRNFPPAVVVPLTADKDLVRDGIARIQSDYVQGLASGSVIWDALVDAAELLDGDDPEWEERVVVLFSDGVDTSSTASVNDALQALNRVNARLYSVAFGEAPDMLSLQTLTLATEGGLFPAGHRDDLAAAFDQVVRSLASQYALRWATLRRTNFTPSFELKVRADGNTVAYNEAPVFNHADHAGDEMAGRLRLVDSEGARGTVAFLRADYVPPGISRMVLFAAAETGFAVETVDTADDGLAGSWSLNITPDPDLGGSWIELQSDAGPIPYGAFGPLLRFDFDDFIAPGVPLFDPLYVDNSVYPLGQELTVEGYPNTPPAG